MKDWEEDLAMSETIFLRASTHGKRSFVGYEGAVIDKRDERLRVFPFPTRRPVSPIESISHRSFWLTDRR
jgi:hypothetical protein